jgi:peptidoglycan hydrolase CwlO-like protein
MESRSLYAKVAIIAILIIDLAVLSYSQSRQDNGPKLPESRNPVDKTDNTVRGVNTQDLQTKIDALETEIRDIKNTQVNQESRIRQLETEQNR